MFEICIYCGEPRGEKMGCCGENHWGEGIDPEDIAIEAEVAAQAVNDRVVEPVDQAAVEHWKAKAGMNPVAVNPSKSIAFPNATLEMRAAPVACPNCTEVGRVCEGRLLVCGDGGEDFVKNCKYLYCLHPMSRLSQRLLALLN